MHALVSQAVGRRGWPARLCMHSHRYPSPAVRRESEMGEWKSKIGRYIEHERNFKANANFNYCQDL